MKASVVIPAHNAAAYIRAAILSATSQTLTDLEVIIVDDASTDDTAKIVSEIRASDPRVHLIQQFSRKKAGLFSPKEDHNPHAGYYIPKGVSASRNAAFEAARGEWIAILDADDEFAPTRLETLIAEAERRSLDAIADNLELFDFTSKEPLGHAFPEEWLTSGDHLTLKFMLDKDTPGNHNHRPIGFIKPVFRRSALRRYKIRYAEDIRLAEDFLLYAQLVLAGGRIGLTGDALYRYAVREGSASNRVAGEQQLIEVNNRILEEYTSRLESATLPFTGTVGDLRPQLNKRRQSIRYNAFVVSAKKGILTEALSAAVKVSPAFFLSAMLTALGRRVPWRHQVRPHN